MKIIKATEPIDVERPVFLIVGQPGIGKTTLGYSAVKALNLDFDGGSHRAINRGDTLQIESWASVVEILDHPELIADYETLVLDTVGRMLDAMSVQIIKDNPKHGQGGALSLQGWGQLKSRFRLVLNRLTKELGKTVILLAHVVEEKDGDTRLVRPDIQGGSLGEVLKSSDFVGYLYVAGKDRILDFNPTDTRLGKNPAGWAPFVLPPGDKATEVLSKLVTMGREALGKASEASAEAAGLVAQWKDTIGLVKDADGANELIRAMKASKDLGKATLPQVKKLLNAKAKGLGLVWDEGAKAFAGAAS